ncbi:endonuclease/exonuclease/phosphatase family protein [Dactylosporangium sp. NPDC051485]|uniref:endonuclease/exonuclease/phosphatase family protein n=1 Tax=Dactylosporangium sp. NPDC051485 TaxID=3154846 RepID=UPI00341E31E3
MTLTLMSYNIKDGGGARLAAIGRVIEGAGPDVVALQELRGEPALDAVTGMRQFVARSRWGQPVGLLVGRHLRVLGAGRVRRPWHHAAVWARLATPIGALTVIGAHLSPYWGRVRRVEAGWLAAFMRRHRPAVLLADLNTLDPYTDHGLEVARLPMPYRRRHVHGLAHRPDVRATALLARRGLVDVFHACGRGQPWTVPTTRGGGAEFTQMRLDYVLATPGVAGRFTECYAVTGGEAEAASDHYPLVARAA